MVLCIASYAKGQTDPQRPVLTIDASKITAQVSPTLYGLMTEEINYSYEGGIYGELIQNRIFRDDIQHWSFVQDTTRGGGISLDESQPISGTVLTRSLKLDATQASASHRVGIANDGYWGIPVKPKTSYTLSFYAKSDKSDGSLRASIESPDGSKVFASAQVQAITDSW